MPDKKTTGYRILQKLKEMEMLLKNREEFPLCANVIKEEALLEKFGMCKKSFRKFCKAAKIKSVRIGRMTWYNMKDIEGLLQAHYGYFN